MTELEDHDAIRDLLGVYAIDAADSDEATLIESHVATCAECRDELDEMRVVAGLIGSGDAEVPPQLWDRIAEQITVEPPTELATVRAARGSPADRRLLRFAVAAVIILVAGVVSLAYLNVNQRSQIDRTNRQVAALQTDRGVEIAAGRASNLPGTRQIALKSSDGDVAFVVVVTKAGTAYVVPKGSQKLAPGHTYQLWGVHGTEAISLGLLGAAPRVACLSLPDGVSALAVTVEADPGVVASRNKPVAQATI